MHSLALVLTSPPPLTNYFPPPSIQYIIIHSPNNTPTVYLYPCLLARRVSFPCTYPPALIPLHLSRCPEQQQHHKLAKLDRPVERAFAAANLAPTMDANATPFQCDSQLIDQWEKRLYRYDNGGVDVVHASSERRGP